MIAIPFAFESPRRQSYGSQIMIGAAIGIVFSLSQQIADHLALLLALNPALSALAPSLLLMALALHLLCRAYNPVASSLSKIAQFFEK
jgi:lipopolysaccharide export system permease protein